VAAQLAALGPSGLDVLFSVWAEGLLPGGLDETLHADERQLDLAREALCLSGSDSVHALITRRIGPQSSRAEREKALELLGVTGEAPDVPLLMEVAEPIVEDSAGTIRDFERQLAAILARDPGGFVVLERAWSDASERIAAGCVHAVGRTRDPRGLGFLSQRLRFAGPVRELAIAQVQRIGPAYDDWVDAELAAHLLEILAGDHPGEMRAAALAVGALGIDEAVPILIGHLRDEDTGLAENCLRALEMLSGYRFAIDSPMWELWWRDEVRWREEHMGATLSALEAADVAKIGAALQELAARRISRRELASAAANLLLDRRVEVRRLAAGALRDLGSRAVVPALIGALEDEDEEVRTIAGAALQALTGRELPMEPAAWRDALHM
jgi:hypothetical protein